MYLWSVQERVVRGTDQGAYARPTLTLWFEHWQNGLYVQELWKNIYRIEIQKNQEEKSAYNSERMTQDIIISRWDFVFNNL